MKRLTWFVPAVVALALLVGVLRARWLRSERALPELASTPQPTFAPLRAPLGSARIAGRVVDIDGAPVADVALYLRSDDVPQWVTSDAEGRFAFEDVAAGEVEVVVLAWGHPPRTQMLASDSGEQQVVLLPPNPTPVRLPDIDYAPVSGRAAHPLGGRWLDADGYEVMFVPRTAVHELGGAVERRTTTDARGFFALEDLALGEYTLRVLPHWARGGSWPDLATAELADFDHVGDEPGAIVPLACGALEALLTDASGAPIEGALALLHDARDDSRVWLPQSSDPLGRVRFLDLPPGDYALLVRAGEAEPPEILVTIELGEIARPQIAPLVVRERDGR